MAFSLEAIEEKIDRTVAGSVAISSEVGGVTFTSMAEVLEFAKLMAVAQAAVPEHLRGNPGACLAITIQALEWRMSPFAVANKSYIANDRVAYESQLVHAVVEARAPLAGRLRYEIIGEGDDRRCKVWGTFKGEKEPHIYISEPLGRLRDARGRNDRGALKGSPLWINQPETQLFYSASRTWARMFCPDVLLGIYAADELPDTPTDVTPPPQENALIQRLKDRKIARVRRKQRGFNEEHVNHHADKLGGNVIEGDAVSEPSPGAANAEPATKAADPDGSDARPNRELDSPDRVPPESKG